MVVISSDYDFPVPATDCLPYIFDNGPYKDTQTWPSNEPIQLSTDEADPSYTFDEIKALAKRVGCGLHHMGGRGKRVLLCGETNIHCSIALLGVLAAGAACCILPPSSIDKAVSYARQIDAECILCFRTYAVKWECLLAIFLPWMSLSLKSIPSCSPYGIGAGF